MNFTGPFVLICGVVAGFIGIISAILMTLYERRHKQGLQSNVFKSVPAFAVLTIFITLAAIPACMLTFAQRGREIILLERDTDGVIQWAYASVVFGLVLFLLYLFVLAAIGFAHEEKRFRRMPQNTSEPS